MRLAGLASLVVVGAIAAGCGGSGSNGASVFAASSLTDAFGSLDPDAKFNFGASDTLAFQIEQGAKADAFASASTTETDALFAKGLVERPRVFARNRLVIVMPRDNPAHLRSWRQLGSSNVRLVLATPGVPAGDYARSALARLGIDHPSVVSEEPDVRGVLTKISLGGADAGIVYATDVRAAGGKVRTLPVPTRAQPNIEYAIAVVEAAPHPDAARAFVHRVLGPEGQAALARDGFLTP